MQRIVVLNPKGGSGKTTLAINLAAYFAARGDATLLIDRDPQGSATRWLRKRKPPQGVITGIATFEHDARTTRSWQMRVPDGTQKVVVDSPAAVEARLMPELTRDANKIIVPVLPSDIDIHAAAKCISNLLLVAKIRREEQRIAVIANRVKKNTLVYKSLMRFLETLNIPVVATLRDSQNYIRVAESGQGLFEMKPNQVREDMEQWLPLIGWLAQRKPLHIPPGTPGITSGTTFSAQPAAAPDPAIPVVTAVMSPIAAPIAASIAVPAASETDPATLPAGGIDDPLNAAD